MTTIDRTLDLDLAPARRTSRDASPRCGRFPGEAAARASQSARDRRPQGLSDSQLADIGLTREDVDVSLNEGRFSDPSGYLAAVARTRRPIRRGR